jgi:TPR repeat protein
MKQVTGATFLRDAEYGTDEAICSGYCFAITIAHRSKLAQLSGAANRFFEFGMMYTTGQSVPADLVAAHKWFNLAAMRGNGEAIRWRREIAAEMSQPEIAAAQRAARDSVTKH